MNDNLKSKTVCVFDNGLFIEWARKFVGEFDRVLYYAPFKSAFPRSNMYIVGEGLPGIERVRDFWDIIDEVDLFVFPDVYDGDLQLHLRDLGKRVWGGGKGEELELYRYEAKDAIRRAGLPVQPVKRVVGLDALREHLQQVNNKYIKVSYFRGDTETFHHDDYELTEPKLDELEYKLGPKKTVMEFVVEDAIDEAVEAGYDGFCIDGQFPSIAMQGYEIKDAGLIGVVKDYNDFPEPVKIVNDKLVPYFKGYNYRGFYSSEVRVTKDGTPYLTDPCFSEDTEILTNNGWKFFYDLLPEDQVCTLDVGTNEIEYQSPTDYIKHYVDGHLIEISNKERGIECLVTPNHNVWRTDRHGKDLYTERADSLTDKGYIPRTGKWTGKDVPNFILPEYKHSWISGIDGCFFKTKLCHALSIPMADWLQFLAIYLSEGSLHGRWGVNITQFKYKEEVREILSRLPFNFTDSVGGFVIHSVQLTKYLDNSGLCNTKCVPEYVKSLTPKLIDAFLDAYLLGDGGTHKGQRLYYTTSAKMADDLQELILKAGRLANIKNRRTAGTLMSINGKQYKRRYDGYLISELSAHNRFWFEAGNNHRRKKYINEVPYQGFVYDVTVPNHTVYVRRNGKPFWSSNCCRAGSPPNELYLELYSNWPEIIWHGAAGELIAPIPVAKFGVEVMIHSTWADKNWQSLIFPPEIERWVKLRNLTKLGNKYYIAPQDVGLPEIGAVVAVDDTLAGAIKKVKERAEQVRGYQIDIKLDSIPAALEEIRQGEERGLPFSKNLPTPEEVAKLIV